MKARVVGVVRAVGVALASKEARGSELALARIVLGVISVKVGIDLVKLLP